MRTFENALYNFFSDFFHFSSDIFLPMVIRLQIIWYGRGLRRGKWQWISAG